MPLGGRGPAAALEALRTENEAMADRIRRLEHLVQELRRLVYGKKSEKRYRSTSLAAQEHRIVSTVT